MLRRRGGGRRDWKWHTGQMRSSASARRDCRKRLRFEPLEPRLVLDSGPVISEFMALNDRALADADGDFSDWIEIHNPTAAPLDLDGWFLTDRADNLSMWRFPAVSLAAGAYLVVFASGKDRAVPAGQLHTNFNLDGDGEYLGLVMPDGGSVAFAYSPAYPRQFADLSYGFTGQEGYFATPTPGAANAQFFDPVGELVRFSRLGGVFSTSSIQVALSSLSPSGVIRYTTNGSDPTAASPLYSNPLTFSQTTRLRARVFAPGMAPGPVFSETYLKLAADVAQFSSNLPIIVIDTLGQTIPGTDSTSYAGSFSMVIDTDEASGRASMLGAADYVGRSGIRVRGRSSAQFPKQPYKLELWDEAGASRNASLLGMPAESDWVLDATYSDKSLMRNAVTYQWWSELNRYSVGTRFVEVFINQNGAPFLSYTNNYWGIYVLTESIKIDGDRVDIEPVQDTADPAQITGGYIVEMGNIEAGGFTTSGSGQQVGFQYSDPKAADLSAVQKQWIRDYINQFEAALYGPNFANPSVGYARYTDVASQVDYDIFREFSRNFDGGSSYFHVDRGGKLTMGPLWDYNMAFGNVNYAHDDIPGYRTDGWNQSYMAASVNGWAPWWNRFDDDPEYQQRFIDRWFQLRRTTLSTAKLLADIDANHALLSAEAAARNFARWPILGQYVWANPPGYETRTTYLSEVAWMKNWLTQRLAWIDSQFLSAPQFQQQGGQVAAGAAATMTAPAGTIYYTLDGSDPRLAGGALSPAALVYSSANPPLIYQVTLVKTRARSGSAWSALNEAQFYVHAPVSAANCVVTEINYHPYAPRVEELQINPAWTAESFQFLELRNLGAARIDFKGARFTAGIAFSFFGGGEATLDAGESLVLAKDPAAFEARYGAEIRVAGTFTGKLSEGGERLTFLDYLGQPIFNFQYSDSGAWPGRADGKGSSLELADPAAVPAAGLERAAFLQNGRNWRSSSVFLGTPGSESPAPLDQVVINEVLARTSMPLADAIELYNASNTDVDLTGFYLSDSSADYLKFRIPDGTILRAHDYLVFHEGHWVNGVLEYAAGEFGGGEEGFALDGARGEDVYLVQTGDGGRLSRFADHVEFGASADGESYGRWRDDLGNWRFYPLRHGTLEAPRHANPVDGNGPRVGPVIVSEVMYAPKLLSGAEQAAGFTDREELEFVAIHNPTSTPVDLTNWTLASGITFNFPAGTILEPGKALVVASFDPANASMLAAFRARYGMAAAQAVTGPYSGRLDNSGEKVRLQRPGAPSPQDPAWYPPLLEDEVAYDPSWGAKGDGASLRRVAADVWGLDRGNWGLGSFSMTLGSYKPHLVAGRHVFYNESAFDGRDAAATAADDAAIAPDKQPLLPGHQAALANYTNYARGINGIMVDLAGAGTTFTTADFEFRVGHEGDPSAWPLLGAPATLTARAGDGVGGATRVTITWPEGAIRNQWLRVTVLGTSRTGLAGTSVFYFGNAVGETGDHAAGPGANAIADELDEAGVRANKTFSAPAAITSPYDINRDRRVNAADELLARANYRVGTAALALLDLTGAAVMASASAPAAGSVAMSDAGTLDSPSGGGDPVAEEVSSSAPNAQNTVPSTQHTVSAPSRVSPWRFSLSRLPSHAARPAAAPRPGAAAPAAVCDTAFLQWLHEFERTKPQVEKRDALPIHFLLQ